MPQPSFNLAPGTSAEQLAIRRRMAETMLMEGTSGAPVQHWAQALNRAAQGLVGGYGYSQAGKADEAEKASAKELLSQTLGLGGGQPAAYGGTSQPAASGSIIDRIIGAESGGRADATNQRSSATGAGQFINSTWLDTLKRSRPDLTQGKSDQELLAMRTDPALSREMTGAYASQNQGTLQSAGQPVTPGTTYLAHFAGPQGAMAILRADPSTPVAQVLGSQVVAANPFLARMTAGDLRQWADGKMRGDPGAAPAAGDDPQMQRKQMAMNLLGNRYTAPYGQAMVSEMITGPKPTDEMREYQLDMSQRQQMGQPQVPFGQWKTDLKRAGATTMTVDQRGEGAFAKKAGEKQAERFAEIATSAQDAQSMVADLGALADISSRVGTGKVAEMKALLGPYAEALGVNVEGLGELQAYEAIISKLAPRMRPPGAGATSDYDARQFLRSLPALGRTPEGNQMIAATFEAVAQDRITRGEIASQALSGELTPAQAERALRELPNPLTQWKQRTGKPFLTPTSGPKAPTNAPIAPSGPRQTAAATPPQVAPPPSAAPPQGAVDMLMQSPTPDMMQYFDAKYGQGAAQRIMMQMQAQPRPQQSYGRGPQRPVR